MKTSAHIYPYASGKLAATLLFFLQITVFHPKPSLAQGETVCLQCHSAQSGKGAAPVKIWKESIHAENGISCHDCHGGNPRDAASAMSPAQGFLGAPKETGIPAFCGRCHVGIKDEYLKSAHGKALGSGGPTCVTCHGSHAIKKVTIELINEKNCSRCHSYRDASRLKDVMSQTETRLTNIEQKLQKFKQMGVDTEAHEKRLFSLKNSYHSLFHEVDMATLTRESARIQADLDKTDTILGKIAEQAYRRKIAGVGIVIASLFCALLLYLLKKTYEKSS